MIRECPNGDSAEVKGLTITVKLGEESMSKIRKAALDEIDTLRDENAKLREENKSLRTVAVRYYTELLHSDDVLGQIMARKKLQELGIEVDDG